MTGARQVNMGWWGLSLGWNWALGATKPNPAIKQHGWLWGCLLIFGCGVQGMTYFSLKLHLNCYYSLGPFLYEQT